MIGGIRYREGLIRICFLTDKPCLGQTHVPAYIYLVSTICGGMAVPRVVISAYAGIQTRPRIEVRGDE